MEPTGATPGLCGGHSNNEEAGDGDDSDGVNANDDSTTDDSCDLDADSDGGPGGVFQPAQVVELDEDVGDGEDGAQDAVEAVVAAACLDAPRKCATKLPVPGCGDVRKAKIVKWLAGEVQTLSADRSKKVSQAHAAAGQHNAAPAFNLSVDDIAVLYDEGYWIGRVT